MTSPLFIEPGDPHPVDRYIERHCVGREISRREAILELLDLAAEATLHEVDCPEPIWRTPNGILITATVDGRIKTVLPAGSRAANRRPRKPKRGHR